MPIRVMVTAVLFEMEDEDVSVSTIDVKVGAALLAVMEVPLIDAVGVADVAKKPAG